MFSGYEVLLVYFIAKLMDTKKLVFLKIHIKHGHI